MSEIQHRNHTIKVEESGGKKTLIVDGKQVEHRQVGDEFVTMDNVYSPKETLIDAGKEYIDKVVERNG